MRRVVLGLSVTVTVLWGAAIAAWVDLRDDTTPDATVSAPITPTRPSWTPPVVLVDRDVEHLVDQDQAQAFVAGVAADPRGWRTNLDHLAIRIVKPGTGPTDGLGGMIGWAYEDRQLALITADAWTTLSPHVAALGGSLDDQRTQIVNHEMGHLLGHPHEECAGSGPAPVMRSWTYKVGACHLNVWPNP